MRQKGIVLRPERTSIIIAIGYSHIDPGNERGDPNKAVMVGQLHYGDICIRKMREMGVGEDKFIVRYYAYGGP
jgi:hypothetical protein